MWANKVVTSTGLWTIRSQVLVLLSTIADLSCTLHSTSQIEKKVFLCACPLAPLVTEIFFDSRLNTCCWDLHAYKSNYSKHTTSQVGKGYHIVNIFTTTPKQKFLIGNKGSEPLTTLPTIHKALTENGYDNTSKCSFRIVGGLLAQCHVVKWSLLLVCQEYGVQEAMCWTHCW